jgi:hypothetical protein
MIKHQINDLSNDPITHPDDEVRTALASMEKKEGLITKKEKSLFNPSDTATLTDIKTICEDGFGDETNRYAMSSAIYNGDLYIGTLNADKPADVYKFIYEIAPNSQGAQVWKGSQNSDESWSWENSLTGGNGNTNNFAVRKMLVVDDYLYAVTANYADGFELWQCYRNGSTDEWTTILSGGNGSSKNASGRGLYTYESSGKNYLFVGAQNYVAGAKMFRCQLDDSGQIAGDWDTITDNGFGETANWWVSDFVKFNNYLYTGTLNYDDGLQIWRSATGDPDTWSKVYSEDISSGNTAAMKLYVFGDYLLVGTQNRIHGGAILMSSDGEKFAQWGLNGGNGNRENIYTWYMKEYSNRLYVSYLNTPLGFNMISLTDPEVPGYDEIETKDGLGVREYFGLRTMEVFNEQFIMCCVTAEKSSRVYSGISNDS